MQEDITLVKAIIGPARSGTTWLGTIMDSHPDVVYRFEPFHRLCTGDLTFKHLWKGLKTHTLSDQDISTLYTALLKAHPLTHKPPFFNHKSYPLFSMGKGKFWPIARLMPAFAPLYRALYSPRSLPPVIFKEVTFVEQTKTILNRTPIPVVYVVRHPCATVLSEIKGQKAGKMPSGRLNNLKGLLEKHDPALQERYAPRLDQLTFVQKIALLWRIEVERCVRAVRASERGLVMTYEQITEDAYHYADKIFNHFGMTLADETVEFLDRLYSIQPNAVQKQPSNAKRGWGGQYFTVHRNPKTQKDAWKAKISAEDRQHIESIVAESDAFNFCAALGKWQ